MLASLDGYPSKARTHLLMLQCYTALFMKVFNIETTRFALCSRYLLYFMGVNSPSV